MKRMRSCFCFLIHFLFLFLYHHLGQHYFKDRCCADRLLKSRWCDDVILFSKVSKIYLLIKRFSQTNSRKVFVWAWLFLRPLNQTPFLLSTSSVTVLSKSLWSKESFFTSKITQINSWLKLGLGIELTVYAIYKQDYVLLSMTDETMPLSAFVFTHNFTFVWFVCILPLVLLSHGDSVR